VVHLSPARYAHINPYGKYRFNVEGEYHRKGLRPLRQPDFAPAIAVGTRSRPKCGRSTESPSCIAIHSTWAVRCSKGGSCSGPVRL
jgi:rRNA maturation protein Nop10